MLAQVALSLFMLGALGLGLDGAQLFAQRQMAQAAADAAAESAIMSILRGTNSTSAHPFSTASSFTCTTPPAALDLRTPCVYAQNNGFGTSNDTVTVSFPAAIAGTILASVSTPAVSVTVQRIVNTSFMRFVGISSSTVTAKASAGIVSSVSGNCLYALDPSAQNALNVSNGANVTMNCAVAVNSNNGTAVTITGGSSLTATSISVVGGYVVNGGATSNPTPTSGAAVIADPFASTPAPAVGACNYNSYNPGWGTWTLNPGVYCNGLTISNGSTATFNPGTYIINGGSVQFVGGSAITGSGVTFYLTGTNASYGSVDISNGVNVTLSAPVSGTYMGLLFYQDRSITSSVNATFAGGSTTQLTGSLYFPTTGISFSNGTSGGGNTAIVAKQVSFSGGAQLNYDPTGTKTGLFTKTVGLLE